MKKNYAAYIIIAVLVVIALLPRKSGWSLRRHYKNCDSGFVPHLLNPGLCVMCPMGATPNLYSGCSNAGGSPALDGVEERRRAK